MPKSNFIGTKETALHIHAAVMSLDKETFMIQDIIHRLPYNKLSSNIIYCYLSKYYQAKPTKPGMPSVYFKKNNRDLFNTLPTRKDVNASHAKNGTAALRKKTINIYKSIVDEMDNVFSVECFANRFNAIINNKTTYTAILRYLFNNKDELSITKHKRNSYKKIGDSQMPKTTELKQQPIEIPSCNNLIQSFLLLSNEEKAKLVSTLMPIVTEQELLDKFNELYPNYILSDAKEKDKLFHPLIGEVEIQTASKNKLSFYGHGQSWECTRNGNLIVNGKVEKRRILFFDLNDYIEYMKTT